MGEDEFEDGGCGKSSSDEREKFTLFSLSSEYELHVGDAC
jgi:hypothetical protein